MKENLEISRRHLLGLALGSALVPAALAESGRNLEGVVGLTTGGLNFQLRNRVLNVFTLPAFMRDEIGMEMIDLNTDWLDSYDEDQAKKVREAAEKAGCHITNLKVNHEYGDPYSPDPAKRSSAMANGRELIQCARHLGARWVRFAVPKFGAGDQPSALSAHRELAEFGQPLGVQLLVENNGWMKSDPGSVARVVKAIGVNVAPGPDTGNWTDEARFEGLAQSFPGAATCDFKVFEINDKGEHLRYDIRKCFDAGWQIGFRGPWAIEHWNQDTKAYARETALIRDQLKKWMAAGKPS